MEPPTQIKHGIRWKLLVTMIGLIVVLLAVHSAIEIAAGLARHHPELGARSLLRRGVSWPTLGFLLAHFALPR